MKKIKTITCLAAVILLLLPFDTIQAWSSFRNEDGTANANTTPAKTPTAPDRAGAKWKVTFDQSGKTVYNSDPVITDTNLYVVCKSSLYELDKSGTVRSTLALAAPMNSICRMTLNENRLFIPLSGGIVQCVNIQTMSSLWTSEPFGLQSLTTTYYHDGCLYAGTTNASGTDGLYYCLSADDGRTQWTYTTPDSPCGYYWSGAISGDSFLLFGGDNGIIVSHSLKDDAVYDTCDLARYTATAGVIRAGITYDDVTKAYYTTTNNGYLYQIKMNPDGTFQRVTPLFLCSSAAQGANCTSTPTIYNGRLYVCSFDGLNGRVNVIDPASMQILYAVSMPDSRDIKSSPLVCTGYASTENNHKVYVYFTQNAVPGGIFYIEDDETTHSSNIKTLYLPDTGKQFCLSSVAADTDGTLYYSNDSGTLFAVQDGFAAVPQTPVSTPPATAAVSPAPDGPTVPSVPAPRHAKQEKKQKLKKPANIKYRKKKIGKKTYRVTFTWKKGTKSSSTEIVIQGKSYKKIRSKSQKKSVPLKKGTYIVRFYSCQSGKIKSGAVKLRLRV